MALRRSACASRAAFTRLRPICSRPGSPLPSGTSSATFTGWLTSTATPSSHGAAARPGAGREHGQRGQRARRRAQRNEIEKRVDSIIPHRDVCWPFSRAGGGRNATAWTAKSKRRMDSYRDRPAARGAPLARALSRGDPDRQRPRHHACARSTSSPAPTSWPPRTPARPASSWRSTGSAATAALLPYHDHNGAAQRPRLLAALAEGRSVALVSDAGTPLVADPGYRLAAEAAAAGHAGDRRAGRLGAAGGAGGRGAADRPLPLRRLPAAARRRPPPRARRARRRPRHARLLRVAAPARREPRRHGRGARRRPPRRGLPRAHQALRGGAPRARSGRSPRTTPPRRRRRARSSWWGRPAGRAPARAADALDAALARGAAGRSVRDAAAEVAARARPAARQVYARALELARRALTR